MIRFIPNLKAIDPLWIFFLLFLMFFLLSLRLICRYLLVFLSYSYSFLLFSNVYLFTLLNNNLFSYLSICLYLFVFFLTLCPFVSLVVNNFHLFMLFLFSFPPFLPIRFISLLFFTPSLFSFPPITLALRFFPIHPLPLDLL